MHKIFSTLTNMSVVKVPSAEVKLNSSESLVFLNNCSFGDRTKVKGGVMFPFCSPAKHQMMYLMFKQPETLQEKGSSKGVSILAWQHTHNSIWYGQTTQALS